MKQMKWVISILLVIGMLVGCGKTAPAKDQKAASKEEVKTTEAAKAEEQPKAEEQTKQDEVKQEEVKNDQTSSTESKSTTSTESKKQEGKATVSAESAPATSSSKQSAPSQSPAPQPPPPPTPVANTVTISITGDKGMGTILGRTEVEIKDGDTVFNVLAYITKKKRIQMEYSGVGKTIYVQGINNLYEKDLGPKSGWMYRVNGVFPNESAGAHKVKNGDVIEWLYTLNLGKDIGGGW